MLYFTQTQLDNLQLDFFNYIESKIKQEKYIIRNTNIDIILSILALAYKEIIEFYSSDNTTTFADADIHKIVDRYNSITGFNLLV